MGGKPLLLVNGVSATCALWLPVKRGEGGGGGVRELLLISFSSVACQVAFYSPHHDRLSLVRLVSDFGSGRSKNTQKIQTMKINTWNVRPPPRFFEEDGDGFAMAIFRWVSCSCRLFAVVH